MKKYLIEFIGTFFLVFVGCGAMVINTETGGVISHVGVAMSWGLIVMVLIYGIGGISGAHINPAVTIGLTIIKKFSIKQLPGYILAQLIGALLAALFLKELFPLNETLGSSLPSGSWQQSFIFELILTFLLMYVILRTAVDTKENKMAAVAIGATVGLEAMFAGPICGASMNPARSIGPALISGHTEHLWVYVVATILGAVLAVGVNELTKKMK
jgi:aquaporin NIP